jgi:predicted phosphoadenosine phosphosulfate sulfurtransferase
MEKIYTNQNVYDAFCDRMNFVFSEFDNIYISFSGGKDSGLLFNLVLKFMAENGISRKIGLFHKDFEVQYSKTIEYVDRTFAGAPDFVDKFWCCLPMGVRNANSQIVPWWFPWDTEHPEKWVREMPGYDYVFNIKNAGEFFSYHDTPTKLYKKFCRWYHKKSGGGRTIALLGIRANESLHRYSAIVNKKNPYKNAMWITQDYKNIYSAAPLYDWTVEDVWTANGKFGFDYNKLYDLLYLANVPLSEMRVASPFIEWAGKSLKLYRIIEPEMWDKMADRVDGANFGAIYGDTAGVAYKKINLPPNHTWQSYAEFLLSTLPPAASRKFREIITNSPNPNYKKICAEILKNDTFGVLFEQQKNKSSKTELLKQKYAAIASGQEV